MLSVEVLGQLRIFSDRKEVTKPRKARALLAVLAVMAARGHTVTRANLAGLLWPYQSGEPGRHSLRNCLMELCKALGPDSDLVLYRDNNVCRLLVPSDVERFEQLAGSEGLDDLREAARLYRGELLEGFEINLDTYDEWLDIERDRLRQLASGIFSKLATSAAAAGDHDGAIAAARRLVDLDELCEESQRGLITALEAAGRRTEAVRQYKRCVEVLRRDLGVQPEPATESVGTRVLQASPRAAANASWEPDKDLFAELRLLQADLADAKTRNLALLEALRDSARALGTAGKTLVDVRAMLTKLLVERRMPPSNVRDVLKQIERALTPPGLAVPARNGHAVADPPAVEPPQYDRLPDQRLKAVA
jgi:DNA-binding SARP family transcriptional activator